MDTLPLNPAGVAHRNASQITLDIPLLPPGAARPCFYPSLLTLPEPLFEIFSAFRDHYALTWRRFPHPEIDRRIEELAYTDFRRDRLRAAMNALEFKNMERAYEARPELAPPIERHRLDGELIGEAHLRDHVDHQQLQRLYALERSLTRTLRALERDLAAYIAILEERFAATPQPENEKLQNEPNAPKFRAASPPRNAPCPCGSGLKAKRCCGKNAPPTLGPLPSPAGSTQNGKRTPDSR
jgi:hypothetical protein